MTVWTLDVLFVLYARVLYFLNYTCSAKLSMFHMERRTRNTNIIIIRSLSLKLLLFIISVDVSVNDISGVEE